METVVKAAAVGICAALIGLLLRKTEPTQSLLLELAAAGLILTLGFGLCRELFARFDAYLEEAGVSAALSAPVLRCLGITLTGRIAGETCRDAGQAAPAAALELTAGLAGLYAALPLVETLFGFFRELL